GDNADIAPNDPAPKAILSFESDVVEAAIGEEIIFDASKSNDQNGQIMQYIWDFGDGIKSEDQIARHAYLESGEYKGKLAVRDSANQWAGIYFIVSVSINPLWWWGLAGLGILFILAVVIFMRKIIKIEKDKPRKPNFKEVEIDKN
ncbi:MAG: PKD domain-containing protein, partial [Patescibacteria group bacterium]|nr:PKD domain-containing protein [Patescibacteria group bacterium]